MADVHVLVKRHVKFTQIAPDRMAIVEGGGEIAVFGTIFLLPGIALMLIGFHVLHVSPEDYMVNGVPVLGLFGVPFVLMGGCLVFKRRWITLDISHRSLLTQWGLLVPMFRKERSLHEFCAVSIRHQLEDGDQAECFPVMLSTGNLRKDLSINDLKTYGEAYAQATKLALFLNLPLQDTTTDHPLELTPGEVEHPLQARRHAEAALPAQITQPAVLRSQLQASASGVQISIPGQVTDRLLYFMALLPAVFIIPIFIACFFAQHALYPFMGFALLILCSPLFSLYKAHWKARRSQTLVSVDSQGITIEERYGKKTRSRVVIPNADIVDIDYRRQNAQAASSPSHDFPRNLFDSKGVSIKAKSGLYMLGAGLPDDEVAYLAAVMKNALA